jgi:MFS family permease
MLTDGVLAHGAGKPARYGSLFYLGFFLAAGSFAPFLNVYFTELGLSGQQVGLLSILSPISTLVLAPMITSLADRRRWRVRLVQAALACWGLLIFFLGTPATFAGIALLMLPLAISFSPIMATSDSLIARMAQRHHMNYGGMRLWGSIGFAASALAFGGIWQRFGFRPMFAVGSLLVLPLIWVTGRLEEGPVQAEGEKGRPAELLRDSGLVLLLLATFLAGISNSLALTFEGIYVRYLGGSNFLIGLMIAFSAFSELPTMFFGQRVADFLSGPRSVILAYGLMGGAYLGYVLVSNPAALPIFAMLKGLGFGLFFPNTVRILTERSPEKWAATAQSLMAAGMFGLAPLVAGPLGGLIHDRINPAAVFGLGILTLGLAAAVLQLGVRRGNIA